MGLNAAQNPTFTLLVCFKTFCAKIISLSLARYKYISEWIMNYDMVIVIYGIWDKDQCVKGGEVLGTSRMVFMGDMGGTGRRVKCGRMLANDPSLS